MNFFKINIHILVTIMRLGFSHDKTLGVIITMGSLI
jgi:hypothetical protein